MRKSERFKSVMAVPSELKTLHVTGTICEVTRIAGAGECVAVKLSLPFPAADENSSPVAGSRCHVTSMSSCRGLGSFFFCSLDFCRGGCWAEIAGSGGKTAAAEITRKNHVSKLGKRVRRRDPGRRSASTGALCIRDSIEIEIAERLFDGAVFGFLQAFGKFSGENVFLGFFGFDGGAKLCFDRFGLLAQESRGVVKINGRGRLGGRNVREHHSEVAIKSELRVAAGAVGFKGFFMFARHRGILRQFAPRGMVPCTTAVKWRQKKRRSRKYRAPSKDL